MPEDEQSSQNGEPKDSSDSSQSQSPDTEHTPPGGKNADPARLAGTESQYALNDKAPHQNISPAQQPSRAITNTVPRTIIILIIVIGISLVLLALNLIGPVPTITLAPSITPTASDTPSPAPSATWNDGSQYW